MAANNHAARRRTLHDLKVARQRLLENRMPEDAAVGYVAHEQLHDDRQLMHCLVEARSSSRGWCAADGLLQVGVGSTVVQLYGPDTTKEVVVASMLRVAGGYGESRLQNELVGLVVQVIVEVIAEETVDERRLCLIVMTERGRPLGSQKQPGALVRSKNIKFNHNALTDAPPRDRRLIRTLSRPRTTPSLQWDPYSGG